MKNDALDFLVKNVVGDNAKAMIRSYNDEFRNTFQERFGMVVITPVVQGLDTNTQRTLLNLVQTFNEFTEDNDPHQEHDFGSVVIEGVSYFWKIDYYDLNYQFRSEHPETVGFCRRVLTIMRADEY